MVLAIACSTVAACANQDALIIAPTPVSASVSTPVPPPGPTPGPGSVTVTLKGRVSESVPTAPTGIPGALVTIRDGVDGGRSGVADALGFYAITDLQPASVTISVSADGFIGTSQSLEVMSNTTSNFELPPVPQVMTHTLVGDIAAGDGTCSDGVSNKACRIVMIPIHHPGPIDATLTWTPNRAANLDLTLFQTNNPVPIARSNDAGATPERVKANLTAASTYELRITFADGSGDTTYTLIVTHLN